MKRVILAAVMSLSSSAFAGLCEVDMVDNYNRIITTIRSYDDYDGCKEAMKACRLEIRQRGLLNRADCVRATDSYEPIPQPIPQPIPRPQPIPEPIPQPIPQPYYGVNVTGLLESTLFSIEARDAAELYINCLTDIRPYMYGSIDDVYFTVNNNRFVTARNSSSWYNAQSLCQMFEQQARVTGRPARSLPVRILGSVESYPIRIEANDRADLLNQCLYTVENLRVGNVDDITYSVNGSSYSSIRNSSSWWATPADVCKAIINQVDSRI